ncbi:TPA: hypothetical protein ACW2VG_007737 [Burkholderia stabilis]
MFLRNLLNDRVPVRINGDSAAFPYIEIGSRRMRADVGIAVMPARHLPSTGRTGPARCASGGIGRRFARPVEIPKYGTLVSRELT